MAQTVTLFAQKPWFPFPLPVCWEWHEGDPLPEGVTFVKGDLGTAMYVKVCLESIAPPKMSITKSNVKEVDVDVKSQWKHVFKHAYPKPLPPPEELEKWGSDKVEECSRYVKAYCNRIDIEVKSDIPEEKFCFILPAAWRFHGILKENAPIPFDVTDTNKVCFTVKHASPTLITIQLVSDIQQTTTTTMNSAVTLIAVFLILQMFMLIIRTLRKR